MWVGLAVSGMALLSVSRVTGVGLNASVLSSVSGCVVLVGTSAICVRLSGPGFGSSVSCGSTDTVFELGFDRDSARSVLGWNGCAVGSSGQWLDGLAGWTVSSPFSLAGFLGSFFTAG